MTKCKCGFKFSKPGEFRNCEAFITDKGESGIICPKCGKTYVDGVEIQLSPKINFCSCGKPEGHKDRCLSSKFGEKKDKIGKYSGKSRTPYGKYEER